MFKLINDNESFLSNLNFEKIEQFTKFVKKKLNHNHFEQNRRY